VSSTPATFEPRILVAYDGSPDAGAAVDLTAALFPGASTVVLTVWEPLLMSALAETAEQGAQRACRLGLRAEPRWEADVGHIWQAILDAAARAGADVIVTGSRGLTGGGTMLAGTVAERVVHHAQRPVLVVPSVATIERRARLLRPWPHHRSWRRIRTAGNGRIRSQAGNGGIDSQAGNGGIRSQVAPLDDR
jgi:nucleotide-binding universal stress UspA family protein